MGQIVIDIPTNKKRRYILTDVKRANELVDALDKSAIQVKNNPALIEDLEYIEDVKAVEKALAEYKRTGKTYKWKDVKAELGL